MPENPKPIYRVGDDVSSDYRCSTCGGTHRRLWRNAHHGDPLWCASCAEVAQHDKIEQYKQHGLNEPISCTIGDLLPARPTPEGDNFWGHSSGDTVWWYKLPQYPDDTARELALVKAERDYFVHQAEYYAGEYVKANKDANLLRRERDEAFRVAKLGLLPR